MAKFTKLSFCQEICFGTIFLFMQMFNVSILQRAITLTELAPSPYFSIINVQLVDINVFAKFDDIPSFTVQDIKEKPKRRRQTDAQCENSIPPTNTETSCLPMFYSLFTKLVQNNSAPSYELLHGFSCQFEQSISYKVICPPSKQINLHIPKVWSVFNGHTVGNKGPKA